MCAIGDTMWVGLEVRPGGRHEQMNPKTALTAVVLITALSIVAAAVALEASRPYFHTYQRSAEPVAQQKQVSAEQVSSVSVKAVYLRVEVIPHDTPEIRAEMRGEWNPSSAAPELLVDTSGGSVLVETRHPRFSGSISSNNARLTVYVPRSYSGEMHVETQSGSISVEGFGLRRLSVSSASGSVKISSVKAEYLEATTSSGSLSLSGLAAEAALRTSSGSISASLDERINKLDAATSSGSISISLPAESTFSLSARTSSGRITCDFALAPSVSSPTALEGQTQAGADGRTLNLRTISGSIKVSKSRQLR